MRPSRASSSPDIQNPRQFSPQELSSNESLFAGVAGWDIDLLCDSRQPPISCRIPPKLRQLFALAFLTPLLHIAHRPTSLAGWRLLLFVPRLALRLHSPKHPDWATVEKRLQQFLAGEWQQLYLSAIDAVHNLPPPRHVPDTIGRHKRAEGLVRRGSLRRALLALDSTPVSDSTPDVLEAPKSKHPAPLTESIAWPTLDESEAGPTVSQEAFIRLLSRCENGVGAGPSGMCFEHIREAALANNSVAAKLHELAVRLLHGDSTADIAALLTASRLIAFPKPGGGTRPIAIGECLHRLVAKAGLLTMTAQAQTHFLPLQFGVAVRAGGEAIVHAARAYTSEFPSALVLQVDVSNAFNSVDRAAIVAGLFNSPLRPLLPFVKLSYGAPSRLYLDAGFCSDPLLSARGVRQGDPMGPLLFSAALHPALQATASAFPSVLCLAYADDITLLGEPSECASAFTQLTEALRPLGLTHNPSKCAAWSTTQPPSPILPPGIPFCTDGLRVLGSHLGPTEATAAFLREQLADMARPLPDLATMDPQAAGLLLHRCVSRRVLSHLHHPP
ncbi:hypothetical protein CLOM_g24534 [Closterium sp. NIES-68]|nr:hypothetical protein CLOM_g24534 [Closterium sp. NIES-68]